MKVKKILIYAALINNSFFNIHSHIITNGVEASRRLGDNLSTVMKTVYFADKFNLKYYYTPFDYSESFALSKNPVLATEIQNNHSKIVFIHSEKDVTDNLNSEEPVLFVCIFLSPSPWLYDYSRKNASFEQKIKDILTPSINVEKLPRKSQTMNVALHVRKGGGYDWPLESEQEYALDLPLLKNKELFLHKKNPGIQTEDIWPIKVLPGPAFITETKKLAFKKNHYADYIWPIKFPPDQYYIEQIKCLANLMPNTALDIQLFTDDPNPEGIIKRYAQALKMIPHLSFYYRKTENNHDKNVIEDLFTIAQCDALICASSSFAFIAMVLGNHSVIIFPEHAITMPDRVIIDKVKVIHAQKTDEPQKRTIKSSIYGINNIF